MSLFLIICRCLGSIAEGFRSVCKLKADLSGLRRSLSTYATSVGRPYWRIDFEIEIFFGQTTLCANLVWKEDVRNFIFGHRSSNYANTDVYCRVRFARCVLLLE